ncbi:hypothetical protein GCM10020254_57700 [Streptomyces goshikiensis]
MATVQVASSYSEYQLPLTAAHEESWTTFFPSRLRTVSRVLQAPETVLQCGKRVRLYPLVEPSVVGVTVAR